MLEGDNISVREVHGLLEGELQKIKAFLQGAVYCWCAIRKSEWFCARDFIGGDNSYWNHYPLGVLYFRHIKDGCDHDYAFDQAAKDAGKILKRVLSEDHRMFETKKEYTRSYRWKAQ